jgi:hypothetical protein
MSTESVTQQQVLEELQDLEPNRWFEVLDFIGFLKEQASREQAELGPQQLTARALLQSEVVGLWADREDIGNSLDFARQLRHQAEHRRRSSNDPG